ncbi:MAG TPA: ArsR family transcriptional regulator [Nitrososphaeraceae archaeon]|nr:ArsR family transcriptional regulator [Nitrososphaeraceae archaeon]
MATKGPSPSKKADTLGDTKELILNLLLEGSKTAGEIADKLKIQKSAIRTHLETLQAEESVRSYFKIERLGRPRKIYELTESGRELFPRKYDLILSLILEKIESIEGHENMKKIIESIADNIAHDIDEKIKKSSSSLEESVRILNSVSNELGFMSSFYKEDEDENSTYSIVSSNCIVHKIAIRHQDAICHGFHDRIIQKSLNGKINAKVQLKECIALRDKYSRHVITVNKGMDNDLIMSE